MFYKVAMVCVAAFVVSAVIGCGGAGSSLAPVTGTVTTEAGDAVEGATVRFVHNIDENKFIEASGVTDSSGKYELEAMIEKQGHKGGPVGECLVDVRGGGVAKKYGSSKTSGLKYEVKKGEDNVYDIKVEMEK